VLLIASLRVAPVTVLALVTLGLITTVIVVITVMASAFALSLGMGRWPLFAGKSGAAPWLKLRKQSR
jgi:hypothetical protein